MTPVLSAAVGALAAPAAVACVVLVARFLPTALGRRRSTP